MSDRQGARGQMLAYFALLLPLLVLAMALGVDAAYLYASQRRMQAAADLSALGGARLLPAGILASARAQEVAGANGYSSGVVVTTPYAGQDAQIEVVITQAVKPFFLPLTGISAVDVSGRAVARTVPASYLGHGIFAGRSGCGEGSEKTLDWVANNIVFNGAVHSNGGILVNGNVNVVNGSTTYACADEFLDNGLVNSWLPAAAQTGDQPWPITYTPADFPCTYSQVGTFDVGINGPWWVGGRASTRQLLPGVYCATGPAGIIKMTTTGAQGTVTFVATTQVELSGSNFVLNAHTNSVLAYSLGTAADALKLNGNNGIWQGIFYAPNGGVDFIGNSNLTVAGGLVAQTISLNGNSATIGPSGLPPLDDAKLQLLH
jgi:hypothetical protein